MSEIIVKNTTDEPDYIKLTYKPTGEVYTLQFSRASALFAQQRGFNPDEVTTKVGYVIPDLFFYAMRKNHPNIPRDKVDKIREKVFPKGLPVKIATRLRELYDIACTTNVLDIDSLEDDEIKNAEVEVEM